jgi:putative proteasome-type protease
MAACPETGEVETIQKVPTIFKAAQLVGGAFRAAYEVYGKALEERGVSFDIMALLGGQIGDGPLRLFQIYSAGNSIEATVDTPYLQIGEPKYGKPILDRAISSNTGVIDALKLGLISMDSTLLSNLSVGMPIDIAVLCRDQLRLAISHRIEEDDDYFHDLRERWSSALRAAYQAIPDPPYASISG